MATVHPGTTLTPHFRDFLPPWLVRQPWYGHRDRMPGRGLADEGLSECLINRQAQVAIRGSGGQAVRR